MNGLDLAWQNRAACKGQPTVLFFGTENERGETRKARIKAALAVCAVCPVSGECLMYAFERHEKYGLWAGMDEDEREQARRTWLRRTLGERRQAVA